MWLAILVSSLRQLGHSGPVASRIGAFVTRNRLGVHSQSTNGRPKCSFPVNSFEANLPPPGRTLGVEAGFAL